MKTTLIACAAVLALHCACLAGGEGWSSDYAGSKKLATETGKDLLIDFTGSDWCGWCIKLNDEVFKHDAFKTGVKDSFVLVEVDFPQDSSKLSEAVRKQNEELGRKYAVKGYPTILLCDAQGRPYASTGYQKGGPEKYVAHLNELRARKTQRDEALAKADAAEGVGKARALAAVLDSMELEPGVIDAFYGDVADRIKAADPQDETGFLKKAENAKRIEVFQEKLQELAGKGDMDGAMALVDATIKEGGFDSDITFNLGMTRVMIYAEQKKFDEAIKALDEIKAANPDSPMLGRLDGLRKQLEEGKAKAGEGKNAPAEEE